MITLMQMTSGKFGAIRTTPMAVAITVFAFMGFLSQNECPNGWDKPKL